MQFTVALGNAGVHVPEDNNPDHGGGPIRRSPLNVMRSGSGMPPYGYPEMVQRTPHQVVCEAEPGQGYWPGRVGRMKFLPDGRMVRAGGMGGAALGAAGEVRSDTAIELLQAQYVALQETFANILSTYKAIGRPIPCAVMGKHNEAVNVYLTTGMKTIDAIYKGGGKVFQHVVGSDGKLALDAQGQPKLREAFVPLRPSAFNVQACPVGTTAARGYGEAKGLAGLGVGPLIVAGIAVGALIAGGAIVRLTWSPEQAAYQKNYTTTMNAYLQCRREAGNDPTKLASCGDLLKIAEGLKPPSEGLGVWAWIGIISVSAVAGAVILGYVRRRQQRGATAGAFGTHAERLGRYVVKQAVLHSLGRYMR